MGTSAVVGYRKDGKFRGTYVYYDGYPDVVIPSVFNISAHNGGLQGVVNWVEAGIKGGGYSGVGVDIEPYNDLEPGEEPFVCDVGDAQFTYEATEAVDGGVSVELLE